MWDLFFNKLSIMCVLSFVNRTDEIYLKKMRSVLSPGPFDDIELSLLQHILLTLLQLFKHVTADYLPRGKFYSVKDDEEAQTATTSAPHHNKLPERVFSYLDYLIHKHPNSTAIANEAQGMYLFNKTADFVDTKNEEELEKLVQTVRVESRSAQVNANQRNETNNELLGQTTRGKS